MAGELAPDLPEQTRQLDGQLIDGVIGGPLTLETVDGLSEITDQLATDEKFRDEIDKLEKSLEDLEVDEDFPEEATNKKWPVGNDGFLYSF